MAPGADGRGGVNGPDAPHYRYHAQNKTQVANQMVQCPGTSQGVMLTCRGGSSARVDMARVQLCLTSSDVSPLILVHFLSVGY